MSDWIDVAAVEDFLPGTFRIVETDDIPIAVFNLDGRYFAIENQSTHEKAELSDGRRAARLSVHYMAPASR